MTYNINVPNMKTELQGNPFREPLVALIEKPGTAPQGFLAGRANGKPGPAAFGVV